MKKLGLNLYAFLVLLVIISGVIFTYQLRATSRLKAELRERERKLNKVTAVKDHITELEAQLKEGSRLEEKILRRIPRRDESVFDLMRTLTKLADDIGIKNIRFELDTAKNGTSNKQQTASDRLRFLRRQAQTEASVQKNIKASSFNIYCDARFRELLLFLKRISELERVISFKLIEIKRDKKLLPRQHITLKLVTYSGSRH